MNLIFAIDRNGCIGKDGSLPWHIPTDLKFFKSQTEWAKIVMGSGTWNSFGGVALKNRESFVLSSRRLSLPDGVKQLWSLDEVVALSTSSDQSVYIIGGANLYNQVLSLATNIYVTYVDCEIDNGDTFIDMDKLSSAISNSDKISDKNSVDESTGLNLRFVHYKRKI